MLIYIVTGSTGEYDDRYEWNVKAFSSKEKADDLCGALNKLMEGASKLKHKERYELQEMIQESLDRLCSIDYTGTYYNIEILELDNE